MSTLHELMGMMPKRMHAVIKAKRVFVCFIFYEMYLMLHGLGDHIEISAKKQLEV